MDDGAQDSEVHLLRPTNMRLLFILCGTLTAAALLILISELSCSKIKTLADKRRNTQVIPLTHLKHSLVRLNIRHPGRRGVAFRYPVGIGLSSH